MTSMFRLTTCLCFCLLALGACKDDREKSVVLNQGDAAGAPVAGTAANAAGSGKDPMGQVGGEAGSSAKPNQPGDEGQELAPDKGATEFVSADPTTNAVAGRSAGGSLNAGPTAAPPMAASDGSAGEATSRAVERGDIYRVLSDRRILNLNSYRGLQIIDVSDVNAPRIEGRLAVAGTPVELYVVGQRAIVLINDWRGYYGSRDDVKVEAVQGGLVLNVDLSDRAHPVLLSQALVPGSISTSRLTQGGDQAALYVAAVVSKNEPPYTSSTLVKSFDVTGNELTPRSEIDLGGYVQDVQATTDLLLVSSQDYQTNEQRSLVSLVDISSPDGTMVRGGSITARGTVQNKFNMDAYNGILRVVSGSTWSGTRENHLETFSLADLAKPRALADCAFGANENLFATIFIEDKAFFVTYLRKDPFHAFSIDDQGRCQEHNQFIVSGWNDFLRPTLNDTRLIGVGRNDEAMSSTVSVSLYDTTNIDNPTPLLARADLALNNSYSEAQWDDRAFSVIDGAVSVNAANGALETGLVLLPFQGWNETTQEYVAQVQVLTFSDRTLTRRGIMDHGSSVRRSFLADSSTAANLSEEELRLFDLANPNSPVARGRVEVAPNYSQLLVYGDHVARVRNPNFYFNSWRGSSSVTPPAAYVEILPRAADLDGGTPLASIPVPSTASLIKVGDLLVSVLTEWISSTSSNTGETKSVYNTKIDIYDLTDPTQPRRSGSLETDRITPYYGGYYYPLAGDIGAALPPGGGGIGIADCFDCYPRGRETSAQYVVDDAIVFVSTESQQKSLGRVHRCYQYPAQEPYSCAISPSGQSTCTTPSRYYTGGITCTTYQGKKELCSGELYECDSTGSECKPIDANTVPTTTTCSDGEEFRYWQSHAFDPLDLRDPDQPVLAPRVAMDKNEEGTTVLASAGALYFNFKTPVGLPDDPRSYAKHYFRRIDFSDPANATVAPAINIPGDVIATEGATVYTRDLVWEDTDTRTLVARLTIDDDLAYLQASRVFNQRTVSAVKLDGAGHILVSSEPAYYGDGYGRPVPAAAPTVEQPQHQLSILNDQSLELSGEANVDSWATFQDAQAGRALFTVSGGLLVFNVEDPTKPVAQAYFPAIGASELFFDGHEAMFAAGPYGIYRFDTDVFNLLTK